LLRCIGHTRGFEGGGAGARPPFSGCKGAIAMCRIFASFSCHIDFHVYCWAIFRHIVFTDGFLFPVKKLGLLTNPGHWVRVLDVVGSYMYIVL